MRNDAAGKYDSNTVSDSGTDLLVSYRFFCFQMSHEMLRDFGSLQFGGLSAILHLAEIALTHA